MKGNEELRRNEEVRKHRNTKNNDKETPENVPKT
jgi:hypothetical protein